MEDRFIDGYRIKNLQGDDSKLNWLFLPGGPGMGSEYLVDFINKLRLPGNLLVGDFPGDGSNRNTNNISYEHWRSGLLKVVKDLDPCIMVTHSFSGMFALTIPELEELLTGFVMISSTPDNGWRQELKQTAKTYGLPDGNTIGLEFEKEPTDHNLKLLFKGRIPYYFLPHELKEGQELLEVVSYNAVTRTWAEKYFQAQYVHSWCPQALPTLIVGSKDDKLLPVQLFLRQDEWFRENIQILVLEGTGHYPWLTHFAIIQDNLLSFSTQFAQPQYF